MLHPRLEREREKKKSPYERVFSRSRGRISELFPDLRGGLDVDVDVDEGGGYIDLCAWSATRGAAPTCLNTNCIFPFSLLRSRLLFNAPATATTRISFPWTSIAYDHGCLRRVNPDIISFFFLFFSLFFALTACGSLGKSQTDRLIFQIFSIKKSPLLSFVLMKKLNISRLR